jgi:hypothetical protein
VESDRLSSRSFIVLCHDLAKESGYFYAPQEGFFMDRLPMSALPPFLQQLQHTPKSMGLLLCCVTVFFAFFASGCGNECADCNLATFALGGRPCTIKLGSETQDAHALLLAIQRADQGYWLLTPTRSSLQDELTARQKGARISFFCGDQNIANCACVQEDAGSHQVVACDNSPKSRLINGMNLLIALSRAQLEQTGFQFQIAIAPNNPALSTLQGQLPLNLEIGDPLSMDSQPIGEIPFRIEGGWVSYHEKALSYIDTLKTTDFTLSTSQQAPKTLDWTRTNCP